MNIMAIYSIGEFSKLIGVSVRTLQRWDQTGRLVADRTATNRRQYTDKHLLVMNTESLSPEQEMVEDLMTIVHCFSSRLYGLRNYRKSLKQALADDTRSSDTTASDL